MTSVNKIRKSFLSYFEHSGHKAIRSGPLIPQNDPTLLFTNAGMVQFKNYFTGLETPRYPRAVTAQKCLRAGGKHNDLDNVGYTARHHTFFEMLGNFSFGDYFKDQAIEHAWKLITKEFSINPDRLLVTVYHNDQEAFDLWRKIAGLPDQRIIRIATTDNFWSMGDLGPCGPCSEIFYDHGDHIRGGPPGSAEEDGDRFIEIWNLVFMQFEQISKDKRVRIPEPSIDTGMGLERIAALLQGKHDNYDTDLFRALINSSIELTGVKADQKNRVSHRVIADHLRASSFLIADGVLPSNEGRGYVLRRIMRRAMRHAHFLGAKEPLLNRLLPHLVSEMGDAYPEIVRSQLFISETLKLEEERFQRTLSRGLSVLEDVTRGLANGDSLDGETAFKLYDTYGFPLDLTQDALRAREIDVDVSGFHAAMDKQKADARASWSGSGDTKTDNFWMDLFDRFGTTEFLGYEMNQMTGVICALICEGEEKSKLNLGEFGAIIVNQTPFYAESGGQIGDEGIIKQGDSVFSVVDTQKKASGLFVHYGHVQAGCFKLNQPVEMKIDSARRERIRANHSATHLLHEALREVLGSHVTQRGSLVSDERLRFDFSHPKPLTDNERQRVENIANEIVQQNSEISTRVMAIDDAIKLGAMAQFGEKYGDEVRVVSLGVAKHGKKAGKTYSLELCGGTHVRRTGDIGMVKLVQESASSAGVRRIEALTGDAVRHEFDAQGQELKRIAAFLKVGVEEAFERVSRLVEERKRLENELRDARKQLALFDREPHSTEKPEEFDGVSFRGRIMHEIEARELKGFVDEHKRLIGSGVVALVNVSNDGKASAVVGVTDDLTSKISAIDLARVAAKVLEGKGGGGRRDMAQAGGPAGNKAGAALEAVKADFQLKIRGTNCLPSGPLDHD